MIASSRDTRTTVVAPTMAGLFYQPRTGLERHRIEVIVLVTVERAAQLFSPAYDGGWTEHDVAAIPGDARPDAHSSGVVGERGLRRAPGKRAMPRLSW